MKRPIDSCLESVCTVLRKPNLQVNIPEISKDIDMPKDIYAAVKQRS